jgi:nucleoside-diphosphate-sugar epimerase
MSTVFVTGANGFRGTLLVRALGGAQAFGAAH